MLDAQLGGDGSRAFVPRSARQPSREQRQTDFLAHRFDCEGDLHVAVEERRARSLKVDPAGHITGVDLPQQSSSRAEERRLALSLASNDRGHASSGKLDVDVLDGRSIADRILETIVDEAKCHPTIRHAMAPITV